MRASGYERNAADWYVEPAWAVDALLSVERRFIGGVMDPCCGGGNVPRQLASLGCKTFAADVVDRGTWPVEVVDDFRVTIPMIGPDSIVSNPPYGDAREFIDCALAHTSDRVCVLLRLAFLEGIARRDWFATVPLARVWVSSRRMSMPPGDSDIPAKGGAIAYAWFVFEHGWKGAPVIGFLPDVKAKDEE
ncbi:TRM11 family methyltransferase [Gluconacetobacter entanii]|uniref:SAM-dependent methyltransferase n=1 Tax=Gluconacetobacter entanii TaxID=108528 RepID=A0A318QC34_9PROT|nr:hypothetical protein [Gluconacetobacter entanii]PYD63547.1 hypothetical protein CFR72_06480 [Gluconacetobacter entanii]